MKQAQQLHGRVKKSAKLSKLYFMSPESISGHDKNTCKMYIVYGRQCLNPAKMEMVCTWVFSNCQPMGTIFSRQFFLPSYIQTGNYLISKLDHIDGRHFNRLIIAWSNTAQPYWDWDSLEPGNGWRHNPSWDLTSEIEIWGPRTSWRAT